MKIPAKLKFYGPFAACLSAGGLFFLCGTVNSANQQNMPPINTSEQQRILRNTLPTNNTVQGKATVNKSYSIQKGVLMIYTETNMKEAATYGNIDPNGGFFIDNVPGVQVIVVLRPDTEAFRSDGSRRKRVVGSNSRAGRMGLTPESKRLWGIDPDKRDLMIEAFGKYWAPDSENALKVKIFTGINQLDFDFKVP